MIMVIKMHLTYVSFILQSKVFRSWYRAQKTQRPDKILDRAGRQHIQQVVGEVTQSFSSVTSALGRSARSQLPIPITSSAAVTSTQAAESSTVTTTLNKRSREERTLPLEQQSEAHEHHLQPDKQRRRNQPKEQRHQQTTEQPSDSFRIDPSTFELQQYKFLGVDIGSLFLDFQHRSTALVNRLEESASIFNLRSFLYAHLFVCSFIIR